LPNALGTRSTAFLFRSETVWKRSLPVNEMHPAIAPVLIDRGESLFAGIDLLKLGYQCAEQVTSPAAMRVELRE